MPDQFDKARDIFLQALKQPVERRAQWLDKQCSGDDELKQFVNDLLEETGRTEDPLEDGLAGVSKDHPTPDIPGYRLQRQIAIGGQGIVYEAKQESTGQSVAIKLLLHGAIAGDSQRARFEREVEILAKVTHPHIVSIVDRGETEDGMPYLVTQFVHGWPVDKYSARMIAADDQEATEILPLFVKIANAIDFAHKRGVIHRDLKPSNILVDPHGEPRILDFGLAKPLLGEFSDARTIDGSFMGSLPWASPEQAHGDPQAIDHRSDVYSLGVILYQMVTGGKFPYPVVGSMRDVLDNILNAKPTPPSELSNKNTAHPSETAASPRPIPTVNPGLEAIVMKALEKSPSRRHQSAMELANEIRDYLAGRPSDATTEKESRAKSASLLPLIASVLAIVVGIWCATQWTKGQSENSRTAQQADNPATSIAEADAPTPPLTVQPESVVSRPSIPHPRDVVSPTASDEDVFQRLSQSLDAKDYQEAALVYQSWRELNGSQGPDIRRCTDLMKGTSDPIYQSIGNRDKFTAQSGGVQTAKLLVDSLVESNLDSITSTDELTSHRFAISTIEYAELLSRSDPVSADTLQKLFASHRFLTRMCERFPGSDHERTYHELRAQAAEWLGTCLLKTGDPYAASQYFRESVLAYANELRDPEYRSDAFFTDVALLMFALPDGGGLHADAQKLVDAIREPSSNAGKVAAAAAQFASGQFEAAFRSWSNLGDEVDEYPAHIAYPHLAACSAQLDRPDDARQWLLKSREVLSSEETATPHGMAKHLIFKKAKRALHAAESRTTGRANQQLITDLKESFEGGFDTDACNAYLKWRNAEDGFGDRETNATAVRLFANRMATLAADDQEKIRLAQTIIDANRYTAPAVNSSVAKDLLSALACWARSVAPQSDKDLVQLYKASDLLEHNEFVTGAVEKKALASTRGWVRYHLARLTQYRGRFDESAESYQRAANYFAEAKDDSAVLECNHELAQLDIAARPQMNDSLRERLSFLQQAHQEHPDRGDFLTTLAACRLRLGYHQQAGAYLERARALKLGDSMSNWLYQAIASRSLREQAESNAWLARFEQSPDMDLQDAFIRRLWLDATLTLDSVANADL